MTNTVPRNASNTITKAEFDRFVAKSGGVDAAFSKLENRATTDAERAAIAKMRTLYGSGQETFSGTMVDADGFNHDVYEDAYVVAMAGMSTSERVAFTTVVAQVEDLREPDPIVTVADAAVASWFGEGSKIKTVHDLYVRYSANTKFNRMSESDFNALINKYVNNAEGSTERAEALEKLGPIILTIEKQDAAREEYVNTLNAKFSNLVTEFLVSRKNVVQMIA